MAGLNRPATIPQWMLIETGILVVWQLYVAAETAEIYRYDRTTHLDPRRYEENINGDNK
jgi:hypothetical protein